LAFRSCSDIQTDLNAWYDARRAAASGRSILITTSAGTRQITTQSMTDITRAINQLESELLACEAANQTKQGLHNFSLANMGDNGANR